MARAVTTFDMETFEDNPLADVAMATTFDVEADADEPAIFESEVDASTAVAEDGGLQFDDDMLQDLVFAFQACDVDGNGYLDAQELLAVIRVLAGAERGHTLSLEIMQDLIREERAQSGNGSSVVNKQTRSRMKAKARLIRPVPLVSTGVNIASGIKRNITVTVTVTVDSAEEDGMASSMDPAAYETAEGVEEETLDYPMFVSLLTSGRFSQYLGDHDDWEDHSYQLRLLKHAWVRFEAIFSFYKLRFVLIQ